MFHQLQKKMTGGVRPLFPITIPTFYSESNHSVFILQSGECFVGVDYVR
jgi:hypothetical protein